ncbi:hypothetical protein [Lichenibacterium ramalinae]|uniref:Uncharacterized protein n=1 Tax=Lichenibacterium ramalinae TaxID=2316527 RepID=A0A4V1RIU8_9HYPH|nr:hypothetical protein [Lichenibacterium ramalinae]RYB05717.1 hypothetical protein D3272_09035 [Lichenibacterium ramalinae]
MGRAAKEKAARYARAEQAYYAVSEIDRGWFAAHPDRNTYIRHATPSEIEFQHLELGWPLDPGPGCTYYTLVRQAAPGVRFRYTMRNATEAGTDVDEAGAYYAWVLFDHQRGSQLRDLEDSLREKLSAAGETVH